MTNIYRYFRFGPLNKKVIAISVPALLTMVSHTVVMITDTAMVGRLNTEAIAATGLGGFFILTIISLFFGLSIAVQIITARRIGEKSFNQAKKILLISLFWVVFLSIIISVPGWFFSKNIALLFVTEGAIPELVSDYIRFRLLGLIFYAVILMYRGFFDGLGMTYVGMAAAFISTASNVLLNWILIYGNLGFPAYGVKGAAIASSLAAIPGLLIFFIFLKTSRYRQMASLAKNTGKNPPKNPALTLTILRAKFQTFKVVTKELISIGLPTASQELLLHVAFLFFYKIAANIGAISMASANILISIMSLSFMPGMAFGIAATTILGQAMGAAKLNLARIATHRAALFAAIVMGSLGILFIVFGKTALKVFTHEKLVIADAYPGLVIVSLIQVGDALHMVYASALRGAGMVNKVFLYYLIASYLIMLPLAYLFGVILNMQSDGLWISVSIWIVFLGINFLRIFNKGEWRSYKV
ncbi:MAG: MATE family efflux transporter [Leptospirales bacterium]